MELEGKVRGMKLGEAQPAERARDRGGMSHHTHFVRLTECSILRLGKRRNSGGSEGSTQGSPSWYVLLSHKLSAHFPILTIDHSQEFPLGIEENGSEAESGGQEVHG